MTGECTDQRNWAKYVPSSNNKIEEPLDRNYVTELFLQQTEDLKFNDTTDTTSIIMLENARR